jgi:hypothetical protein
MAIDKFLVEASHIMMFAYLLETRIQFTMMKSMQKEQIQVESLHLQLLHNQVPNSIPITF